MATTIKLKNSVVKDKEPLASDLQIGEIAVGAHEDSPALFFKDNADHIVKIEPGSAVDSVNGKTGVVVLTAADVSALAAGDNVSELANDAAYITLAEVPSALVSSVNTKTGDVVLSASDVGAATAAQGTKADSAVQSGDNVSDLNNDAGYLTSTTAGSTYLPLAGGDLTGPLTSTSDITAAGNIDSGGRNTAASDASGTVLVNDGTFLAQKVATDPDSSAFLKFGRGKESGGAAGEGVKCQILADGSITAAGSATFAGNVDAYGYVSKGNSSATNIWTGYHIDGATNPITSTIKADGSITGKELYCPDGSGYVAVNGTGLNLSNADGTPWAVQLSNDGSITAAGSVTANGYSMALLTQL